MLTSLFTCIILLSPSKPILRVRGISPRKPPVAVFEFCCYVTNLGWNSTKWLLQSSQWARVSWYSGQNLTGLKSRCWSWLQSHPRLGRSLFQVPLSILAEINSLSLNGWCSPYFVCFQADMGLYLWWLTFFGNVHLIRPGSPKISFILSNSKSSN